MASSNNKQNVIYVEPGQWINKNDGTDIKYGMYIDSEGSSDYIEIAPDIQDYSVTVDLQVEIPATLYNSKVSSDNDVITMSFTSTKDSSNSSVSFFSGTKQTFNDVTMVDLSTSPYDCMSYQDLINGADTKEMFGINSIDIEYNNYAVPVVTINFTDIRGIGLFASEELIRNSQGEIDVNKAEKEMANTFFRCFFTFPYPKFTLMVKGFYGHPVTYELFCADFKASFDSNSGNFNAVAKFVGYSFSLLNDITMNALIAAPLSDYHGEKYWNDSDFTFDDNYTKIPKLNEFLDNYRKIQEWKSEYTRSEETRQIREIDEKISLINNALTAFDNYFDEATKICNSVDGISDSDKDNNVCYYAISTEGFDTVNVLGMPFLSVKPLDYEENVNTSSNSFTSDYIKYKFTLSNCLEKLGKEHLLTDFKKIANEYQCSKPLQIILPTNGINSSIYVFDGYYLLEELINEKEKLENELDKLNKLLAEIEEQEKIKVLGFNPNVKNVTQIILAHLETLLACIYHCNNEVNESNRKPSDFNVEIPLPNYLKDKNVDLFPEIVKKNEKDNKQEKYWIGDVANADKAKEINLIHGLLNGINKFENFAKQIREASDVNSDFYNFATFTDIFSNNPFNKWDKRFSLTEFSQKIAMRMFNVLGTNELGDNSQLIKEIGKIDAHNFALVNNNPTDDFLTAIQENGTYRRFHKEDIEDIFYYDSDNKRYETIINPNSCKAIPISGINTTIYDDYINNYNLEVENFLSNIELKDNYTNIIKIDKDVEKYVKIASKYENQTELWKRFSVDNTDDSYKKFYEVKDKMFMDKKNSLDIFIQKTNYTKRLLNDLNENSRWYYTNKKGLCLLENKKKDGSQYNFIGYDYETHDETSVWKCIKKIDNIIGNDFTISYIQGYKYSNNSIERDINTCLFTQEKYYEIYEKHPHLGAYLFINSIFLNDEPSNKILNTNINVLPYIVVLQNGSYLWLLENGFEEYKINKTIPSFIDGLNECVKNSLIHEFEQWATDYYFDIHKALSLNNVQEFKKVFQTCILKMTQEPYKVTTKAYVTTDETMFRDIESVIYTDGGRPYDVYNEIKDYNINKFNHYRTILPLDNEFILINKESSDVIQSICDLLVQKVVILNTSNLILGNSTTKNEHKFLTFTESNANIYYSSLIDELNVIYKDFIDRKNAKTDTEGEIACSIDTELKIAMYNYLKILWDRWLKGEKAEGGNTVPKVWSFIDFKKRFHFIDSFYQDVSHGIINPEKFAKDLLVGFTQTPHSVLTFLSTAYQKNRFMMFNVQNFANFSKFNGECDEKMREMFKPLAYNEITKDMIKKSSDIVVLYGAEYSSKLNLADSPHVDDSFCFDTDDLLQFNTSGEYRIPAFGVTYGKQYQSYFKDISVSMDSPVASEQALRARFEIASTFTSQNGENGNHVVPIGADLFTVYSNNSYSCTVKMMGCAWVQPMMYFQLNNVPMFRGAYLIHKVTHHIEPGNMETTITGMRMSKYSTKVIDKAFVFKENNDTGGKDSRALKEEEYRSASIYNNCEYKYFNPLESFADITMPIEDLDLTLQQYSEKYPAYKNDGGLKTFNVIMPSGYGHSNLKVIDLLSIVAYSEASTQDELGVKLVLNVIFNRYLRKGKKLHLVFFNPSQHSTKQGDDYLSKTNIHDKYNKYVKDIFLNGPNELVGKITKVENSLPICVNGEPNGSYTKAKEITQDDVKCIDMYCTVNGYNVNYNGDDVKEENAILWRKQKYCLHHEIGKYGHVFVSENDNAWKGYSDTKTNPSFERKVKALINSIQQTINYSSFIDNIKIKVANVNETASTFEIHDANNENKSSSGLSVVFDILVNSEYCKFVEGIDLYHKNDLSQHPYKIIVFYNTENLNRLSISNIVGERQVHSITNFNDVKINELMLYTLKKKYGDDINSLKTDCSIFSGTNKERDGEIKKLFDKITITDCKNGLENGFSSDGSRSKKEQCKVNTNPEPKKVSGSNSETFSIKKMVEHVVSHLKSSGETGGQCALYVKDALNAGGLNINYSIPSAYMYSKHLPVWGFEKINVNQNYQKTVGDISVTQPFGEHCHGHIQIYADSINKWCSDKAFNSTNGYNDENSNIKYEIYRWKGKNDMLQA